MALQRSLTLCTVYALTRMALGQTCLYTLSKADTFYRIAAAQGCSTADIIAANAGVDYNELMVGQLIVLPDACKCPVSADCTVTVSQGDTAYSMATARGCYATDFEAANPGIDWDDLPLGLDLTVPTDTCRCSADVVGCAYVVKRGDTLTRIAAALHCPQDTFIEDFSTWNPGLQPDFLLDDQKLIVPPSCECPDQAHPGAPFAMPDQTAGVTAPIATTQAQDPRSHLRGELHPARQGAAMYWLGLGSAAAAGVVLGAAITAVMLLRKRTGRKAGAYVVMQPVSWEEAPLE